MTWVFVVLTFAGIGITIRLIVEHLHDTADLQANLQRTRLATIDSRKKLEELNSSQSESEVRVKELTQAVNQLETTSNELMSNIVTRREEKAKKGKYRVER